MSARINLKLYEEDMLEEHSDKSLYLLEFAKQNIEQAIIAHKIKHNIT